MPSDKAKPRKYKPTKWGFEGMKPGDSFYFEGINHRIVCTAYSYYLARGKYTITKEGKGFRFQIKGGTNATKAKTRN